MGVAQESIAGFFDAFAKHLCHSVGMCSHLEVDAVLTAFEQSFKLYADETSLCQHAAVLFDNPSVMIADRLVKNNYSFPKQSAIFVPPI